MIRGRHKGFYDDVSNLSDEEFNKLLEESYLENGELDEQMAEKLLDVSWEVDNILYDNNVIDENKVPNLHEKIYNQESIDIQKTIEYLKENLKKGD